MSYRSISERLFIPILPTRHTGVLYLHGLHTNVLGLTSGTDWQWLGLILSIAMLTKMVPVYFVGRACGFNRHESLSVQISAAPGEAPV